MQEIMVPCKKCKNKAAASSMKLDLDEKMMICPDCVKSKKVHKQIQQEVMHKDDAEKGTRQNVILMNEREKTDKEPHKCKSCGYKFMINQETGKPKNCPYCNVSVRGF